MIQFQRPPGATFGKMLRGNLLFFALPMVLLEFIGVPPEYWLWIATLAAPVTILVMVGLTWVEWHVLNYLARRQNADTKPAK
jgi:hypothetical protein